MKNIRVTFHEQEDAAGETRVVHTVIKCLIVYDEHFMPADSILEENFMCAD